MSSKSIPASFQSHAGSIEAQMHSAIRSYVSCEFQSHAGSIEAGALRAGADDRARVSIPRWFD